MNFYDIHCFSSFGLDFVLQPDYIPKGFKE
nr:MAG TPA: protein of unknown function (DUF4367) [Bacteriophage sp.]